MKKAKKEIEEPSAPFWMTTFSDMVTLLLVFFILILSYSTVELEKFKGAMSSMKGALGMMPEKGSAVPGNKMDLTKSAPEYDETVKEALENLNKSMKEAGLDGVIEIDVDASGIHIRLGDRVLYDVGKAKIKPASYRILQEVAMLIGRDTKEIYVEGHTDNIPIKTAKFPSNWELSTARAMSVIRYLHEVEGIDASKLAAVGHGEYRPIAPNTTRKGQAKNRRVEIFIKWQ